MSGCLAITRNGAGAVWRFASAKAAQLHPLVQLADPVLVDASSIASAFTFGEIKGLFASDPRLLRSLEAEFTNGYLPTEIVEAVWRHLSRVAATPPSDPAEIVRLIVEDRKAIEGTTLVSRQNEVSIMGKKKGSPEGNSGASDAAPARAGREAKYKGTDTIRIKSENNPKRAGTKAYERFALYSEGMTVESYLGAGGTRSDLAYDVAHDYVSVQSA